VGEVRGYVDIHSHVVPSGDDGARSLEAGLALCLDAGRHGTRTLYGTPHVWPSLPLTAERERVVRAAHAEMAAALAPHGVDLRLGWELTPSDSLLDEDPARYRLGDLRAVLMEVPFHGALALSERLAEHIEAHGLTPIVAHPERAESVRVNPGAAQALRERDWLIQVNSTSLLGYHGPEQAEEGWRLVEDGLADLVASDGHRSARPPFLDAAYELVLGRVGAERADALFRGRALEELGGLGEHRSAEASLVRADGLDLAQRG
jgi:protein-tyrosine phosphatase